MKYALFTAAFLSLFHIQLSAQSAVATVSGNIKNRLNNTVYLLQYDYAFDFERQTIDSCSLSENGDFKLTAPLQTKQNYLLKNGKEYTNLTLYPGQHLKVQIDAAKFDESVRYSGDGALINNYIVAKNLCGYDRFFEYADKEENEFLTKITENENRLKKIHQRYATKAKTDNDKHFFGREKELFPYQFAFLKIQYPMYYAMKKRIKANDVKLSAGYYDFLKNIKIENESLVNEEVYYNFLNFYANEPTNTDTIPKDKYKFVSQNFSPKFQELLLPRLAINALEVDKKMDKAMEIKEKIKSINPKNPYIAKIDAITEKLKKLQSGLPAPVIFAKDTNGKEVKTTDFLGKVLYIDLELPIKTA